MKNFKGKKIWIVGASEGLGKGLAKELANRGATLILSARNKQALEELQKKLPNSKLHTAIAVDVSSRKQVESAYKKIGTVDAMMFAAGIYKPMPLDKVDKEYAELTIDVNLKGAIYVTEALLADVLENKCSALWYIASVAGYYGLPQSYTYGASKAALINYVETLQLELSNNDVEVRLINPGFVKTRLTDQNEFDMPSLLSVDKAVEHIINGLSKSCFEIHFPKQFTIPMKIIQLLPYSIRTRILSKFKPH